MAPPIITTVARCWRYGWPHRRIHMCNTHASTALHLCAAACCILLSLMGWACAGADDSPGETVRSDSASIHLVTNSQPDRMLDWTFERILDLGGAAEGPTALFRVFPTSIGVDSLGQLYVLDAGNYRISVFDRTGRHLRSFGRQGEGPGELGFPASIAVTPAGEVAVYDFMRRALVHFDADGSFTGTFAIPGPLQEKVVLLDDGRIAAAVTQPTSLEDALDYRLLTLGADTVELARVRQSRPDRQYQFSCPVLGRPPYFQVSVVWDATGDRIAFSDEITYSVHIVGDEGLAAIWRRDLPVIPSTLELAAWEVAEGDSLRLRDCVVAAEEAARELGYADFAPLIKGLTVAPDGQVWVMRRTQVPGETPIDVFDATGAYVGTLPDDSPFPALFRGADEIATVETDEFDVPHVRLYRIHRGS